MDADDIGTVGDDEGYRERESHEEHEEYEGYEEHEEHEGHEGHEEYEFPTSDAQARLLVLDHMDPGSATYHVPAAFAVRGPFDAAAFGRALDALVARHESLRTVFRTGPDGVPLQIVSAVGRVEPRVERAVPVAEVDARMRTEAARPFDVAAGPLLRCTLYAVSDGTHRILLVAHHLVCDGWSLGVLLRELSAGYENETKGLRHALPELPLQFPDFAAWQRERQAAGEYAGSVAHWVERLRGAPGTVALPLDRPRGAVRSAAGGTERFTLSARVRARVAETARGRGGTPFMAVFAAYAAFVSRLSGSEDLVIGFPVSGRDRPELQDMVGMLTNTLALRVDLSGDPSYHDLIARLRTALLDSQPHQDAPFEAVVNAVAPAREISHDPVVQVMFGYDDDTELTLGLAGAEVERVHVVLDTAKFDFHLQVEQWGEDLAAYLIYRSALFESETVRRWVRCFETLLEGLLERPEAPLSAIDMLPPDERELLLALGTATPPRGAGRVDMRLRRVGATSHNEPAAARQHNAAHPEARLVPDLVADRAAEQPEATALVCGDLRLTYRELLKRADTLAAHLQARGVRRGDRVGLLLPRGIDMAVTALAVLRAGGAYVPLDPAHPTARLAYMVTNSGASLLLTAQGTTGLAGTDVPELRVDQDEKPEAVAPLTPVTCTPDDLAYVLYTSGSTGVPKGVAVEHRALLNLAVNVRPVFPVTETDRVLQFVSFGFDVAVSDLFFPWVAGAELHIAQEDERLGEALQARLRDSRITYVFLPPSAAMTLPRAPGDLPELRTLAVGGEACPAELVERLAEEGRRIVNAYGPSEATVYSTTADLRPGEPVVIGHAVPGTRAYVLDRRLRPVPVGVTGELYVAGASLARGYFGRSGMTAERFVADPYGPPGSRMYRTGDLCRIDARGVLHYLGRGDSQVKLRGYRIELGEIEALLAGHPDITVAAAAVRGEGAEQRLVAYVVGKGTDPDPVPSDEALRALLALRLPGYMVPEIFVRLPELPLNRSGKIDRARLPEPSVRRPRLTESYAAPRTAGERRVAEVWQQVLTLDRVGVHDNFFDLGGNSVRLLAVLSALQEHPEYRDLTLIDLFRHPTVAAVAAHLDSTAEDPAPHDEAARRGSDRRQRQAALHKLRSRKGTTR